MTDRQFQIHMARVLLSDCRTRRHWPASRNFYWQLFAHAQRCRKAAAAMTEIKQGRLFG
jgi:hypothetical protein